MYLRIYKYYFFLFLGLINLESIQAQDFAMVNQGYLKSSRIAYMCVCVMRNKYQFVAIATNKQDFCLRIVCFVSLQFNLVCGAARFVGRITNWLIQSD